MFSCLCSINREPLNTYTHDSISEALKGALAFLAQRGVDMYVSCLSFRSHYDKTKLLLPLLVFYQIAGPVPKSPFTSYPTRSQYHGIYNLTLRLDVVLLPGRNTHVSERLMGIAVRFSGAEARLSCYVPISFASTRSFATGMADAVSASKLVVSVAVVLIFILCRSVLALDWVF